MRRLRGDRPTERLGGTPRPTFPAAWKAAVPVNAPRGLGPHWRRGARLLGVGVGGKGIVDSGGEGGLGTDAKAGGTGVHGAEAALDIEGKWGSERNEAWSRRFAGWETAEPFPMCNGRDARCPSARFADEGMNVIFNDGLNLWAEPVKKGVWRGGGVEAVVQGEGLQPAGDAPGGAERRLQGGAFQVDEGVGEIW